jgi:hypothetical protein
MKRPLTRIWWQVLARGLLKGAAVARVAKAYPAAGDISEVEAPACFPEVTGSATLNNCPTNDLKLRGQCGWNGRGIASTWGT